MSKQSQDSKGNLPHDKIAIYCDSKQEWDIAIEGTKIDMDLYGKRAGSSKDPIDTINKNIVTYKCGPRSWYESNGYQIIGVSEKPNRF